MQSLFVGVLGKVECCQMFTYATPIVGSTTTSHRQAQSRPSILLLDIIMGIHIQAQAIPMNSGVVKARLQHIEPYASESDATLQIDDLTNSTVQSSLLQTHTTSASASTSTRRREDKALRKQYLY